MITTVGFGKKRTGMSHEECIKHHREVHSVTAKRLIGHRGLEKYFAYYVDKAFALDGEALAELPWDLVVPESYTDEFWKGMENWRKTNPDGIWTTEDEARFVDRKTAIMMTCQENVIVGPKGESTGISAIFLISRRSDMSHEECVKHHREVHAPMAARMLGPRFKKYVAYYVDECFSLVGGLMPKRLYDIIVVARFDDRFWVGMDAFRKTSEGIKITEDEERFIDRKSAITLVCQENVIIP